MARTDDRDVQQAPRWRRLRSEIVHRNQWFEVRQDSVVRPDDGRDTYFHVVSRGSVTVLALDGEDRVALTRQWIYTHGSIQWRLPGGGVDSTDSGPLAAARRELSEEAGLAAEHWERLGVIHNADSLSNCAEWIFVASGLTSHAPSLEPGEADLTVSWKPFSEVVELVTRGEVPHAGSAHAVLTMALRRSQGQRSA